MRLQQIRNSVGSHTVIDSVKGQQKPRGRTPDRQVKEGDPEHNTSKMMQSQVEARGETVACCGVTSLQLIFLAPVDLGSEWGVKRSGTS